jgi:hypothetical protein
MVGATAQEPTAVLVVAAWREGMTSRVVARITYTSDVTRSDHVTVIASGLDEIAGAIRGWLEDVSAVRDSGDAPVTGE